MEEKASVWDGTDPIVLDESTLQVILEAIQKNSSWTRAAAIGLLGSTKDARYADLYIRFLNDSSDRVVNAAAVALGKTKSPKAFAALVRLKDKPSWKNQSLISCLNGLKELGDPRGYQIAFKALSDVQSPRWTLATPVWDYQLTAAQTIVGLGKSSNAYPYVDQAIQ